MPTTPENPYSSPTTDERPLADDSTELAGRGTRLAAAIVDGALILAVILPIALGTSWLGDIHDPKTRGVKEAALGALLGIGSFMLMNGYLLATRGQTIGKLAAKIRIGNLDGSRATFSTILFKRLLPIWAISLIPQAGNIINLVDPLFIFGKERRCLHDLIAGTRVFKVEKSPARAASATRP